MASAEQMRDRASHLFAMALRARPDRQINHSSKLTKLAWDALEHAGRAWSAAAFDAFEPTMRVYSPPARLSAARR
jgi:hypothetical protein